MSRGSPFVDWVTVTQYHESAAGQLPLILGGLHSYHSAQGVCLVERLSAARLSGSFDTSLRFSCDGSRVYASGNVGRFGRSDNLFNHQWRATRQALDRICDARGVLRFGSPVCGGIRGSDAQGRGDARIRRLDLTANFATGSDAQAREVIRWLAGRSVARAKRGRAGDESIWFANSRKMLKAYLKGAEMAAHGGDTKSREYQWCMDNGIVRVEVELKRRLLTELGLDDYEAINDEKLAEAFRDQTDVFRAVDRSDEPDILMALPKSTRFYACAWLGGRDLTSLGVSRSQLYHHAKICRQYGLEIMEPRNLEQFPTKVRIVDLHPVDIPDWYDLEKNAA